MHVDITTTLSLKDDDGREITRTTSKSRTMSFTLEDTGQNVAARINAAMSRAKRTGLEAIQAILASLRA